VDQNAFGYYTSHDDYLAGHDQGRTQLEQVPSARFVHDTQWHALVFLGQRWGRGGVRFSTARWLEYCRHVFARQGVITFDVGKNMDPASGRPIGAIAEEHLEQLRAIKREFR